ncbi:MAG: dihydroxy-acid dehydratase [Runella slithyformis]|nr:MAG: dihydroxy-acid dehydratase [Runella slithyformis]TAE97955.1 MAG: dihydroxy-acid dehydratase [Runella slithyformis]TAF27110.1 MAG: dihydroxy-acid dehydratase [Runella slithyformis]TAF45535.1 MAG: dihydroxy-acid dehydratase [Runella slithyformis]TAF80291.1 MAG: dihydroxy-acid dehydratase [Runella slithyformis]
MATEKTPLKLRSQDWFGKEGKDGFIYRSWIKNQGHAPHQFKGKPVIGICNTWSEVTPCNGHFRDLAQSVKNGVYEAGGFPLEFPVMSLGETLIRPTAMLYRNLASMTVEESIRANPFDAIVLLTGCDKTTPSLIMGAASVDLPTIVLPGGPMLAGRFQGKAIGSGTDVWRFADDLKTGKMTPEEFEEAESCMSRSIGHCSTMGTASTMATMAEALGLTLPGLSAIPAADSRKKMNAHLTGMRIVEMAQENLTLSKVLTREAFENAIMLNAAVGGSTNFVLHLLAIAGRMGVELSLDDFDKIGSRMPFLLNVMPSGTYLMEDYFYAGGLPVIIKEFKEFLHNTITVNGKSLVDNSLNAKNWNEDVIASAQKPILEEGGIAVVKGNLCENGAVIKPSAASAHLLKHQGRAVVFETIEDYHARIDNPDLDIDETSVMVLKNVGPKGYPGMPEVGNMALPKKLLEKGITDMVRISDARMSGTAYGTVLLHASPESAIGGNLALVENGDLIEIDIHQRYIHWHVSEEEIARRRAAWQPIDLGYARGHNKLYIAHVTQSHEGCDFDFLVGKSGSDVQRESH